jgi:hypothetical protein
LFDVDAVTQISFEGSSEIRRLRPPRQFGIGIEAEF